MNAQLISKELNKLNLRLTDRTAPKATQAILDAGETLAPILEAKGLQISKGSSSPTTQRSYDRIYLEKVGNQSHDSRHSAYAENVVDAWEWETYTKYGFKGITFKALSAFLPQLIEAAKNA